MMNYYKSLLRSICFVLFFILLAVGVNFYVDHYAVRQTLFSGGKPLYPASYPDGINQHIFNVELILRNPEKFDSFLFGSSRVNVIDVGKIPSGRFYNMSYIQGLPTQHLAVVKAFLKEGIQIKSVVVGLDGFCFNMKASDYQYHLTRVMHPKSGGPGLLKTFGLYFFRKPDMEEIKRFRDRKKNIHPERRYMISDNGRMLTWQYLEKVIANIGKPLFSYEVTAYEPLRFESDATEESFTAIEELLALSRQNNFTVVFFISPFYHQLYLNKAEALFKIKKRLATVADYYDFSGFNSITTNPTNYYEESHYRYHIGDMILRRIYDENATGVPDDFGILVTKQNIDEHVHRQKLELKAYLHRHNMTSSTSSLKD